MLKKYKYKIQWLVGTAKQACKLVDALGAKSLDWVEVRDKNMEIVARYDQMVMLPYGSADSNLKKWIRKQEKSENFRWFEIIRKY